jgi:HK97 family phage major capsid protein
VFGEVDGMGDTVAPGAFKRSLAAHARKGRAPLMLWSHQLDQPIGRWTHIRKTDQGLAVRGKLLLDVARALIPRRLSTLSAAWVDELAQHATSEPTYDQVSVSLFEMRVTSEISNQLLEDAAFPMDAELARDLAEQFAFLEGQAFVAGTGTGQPQGFLTSATFPTTSVGAPITADHIIDLFHAVATAYASNGTWLMNRAMMGQVRKLKTSGTGVYLWTESLAPSNPPSILGRPVVEMPAMPATTGQGSPAAASVAFGDWSQAYRIFDRVDLEVLRDPSTRARNSIVAFHARRRVGGSLVKAEAVRGLSA